MVPESQNCEAILQAWYAGEAGGQAVADVLFGDYNPAGHLPVTFYKSVEQLPDFSDYHMAGRTYRYMTQEPLFPFGYGLSYTQFNIGNASINKKNIAVGEQLQLTIPVTNTGNRNGTQILQVYIHKKNDPDGPVKTLRSFKRMALPAGKMELATINLTAKAFEFFDPSDASVKAMPGEYQVFYGTSSDNKDLKSITVTLK
jgi:beta-glucosidase